MQVRMEKNVSKKKKTFLKGVKKIYILFIKHCNTVNKDININNNKLNRK